MVYLLIFLILASSIGILVIISRKFAYLKKISPDVIIETEIDRGFFVTYFQEIAKALSKLNLRGQSIKLLAELEKVLRSIKVLFLKTERYTSSLINNIQEAVKEQEKLIESQKKSDKDSQQIIASKNINATRNETPENSFVAEFSDAKNKEQIKETSYKGEVVFKVHNGVDNSNEPSATMPISSGVIVDDDSDHKLELRKEEQRLIMSIAKAPKEANLYKLLGDVYYQLDEYEDARQSYAHALRLDPSDYILKTKLSKVLRKVDEIS